MTKKKRSKNAKWFVKVRGSYLPNSWLGWLTYIPFVAYLIWAFVELGVKADSTVHAVFAVFSAWVAAAVVMTWLAAKTS